MALQRTFSIIKPDATRRNITGQINARLEAAGLRIVAQKRKQLSEAEAQAFYAVHKERPFYNDLVAFMTSGPVVLQVLEGGMPSPGTAKSWAPRTRPSARHDPQGFRQSIEHLFMVDAPRRPLLKSPLS